MEQDAEGVASFYTCDGMIMITGTDVVRGKEGTHSPKIPSNPFKFPFLCSVNCYSCCPAKPKYFF